MSSKNLRKHFQKPFCGLLHGNILPEEESYHRKIDNDNKHDGKAFNEVSIQLIY